MYITYSQAQELSYDLFNYPQFTEEVKDELYMRAFRKILKSVELEEEGEILFKGLFELYKSGIDTRTILNILLFQQYFIDNNLRNCELDEIVSYIYNTLEVDLNEQELISTIDTILKVDDYCQERFEDLKKSSTVFNIILERKEQIIKELRTKKNKLK